MADEPVEGILCNELRSGLYMFNNSFRVSSFIHFLLRNLNFFLLFLDLEMGALLTEWPLL